MRLKSGPALKSRGNQVIPKGDRLIVEMPGGGGLGNATERDPALVADDVRNGFISKESAREVYKVGLNTSRLLLSLGDLVVGWLLLRQADVALLKLTEGAADRDKPFYEGKIVAAKFFVQSRLPLLTSERVIVEGTNLEVMDLDETAF